MLATPLVHLPNDLKAGRPRSDREGRQASVSEIAGEGSLASVLNQAWRRLSVDVAGMAVKAGD